MYRLSSPCLLNYMVVATSTTFETILMVSNAFALYDDNDDNDEGFRFMFRLIGLTDVADVTAMST